jgi:hypothetical protein
MDYDDRTTPIDLPASAERIWLPPAPARIAYTRPPLEQRILVIMLIVMLIPVASIEFATIFSVVLTNLF